MSDTSDDSVMVWLPICTACRRHVYLKRPEGVIFGGHKYWYCYGCDSYWRLHEKEAAVMNVERLPVLVRSLAEEASDEKHSL